MRITPALFVPLLALPLQVFAQQHDEFDIKRMCQPWMSVPIPQQDIGTAPKDCASDGLYYGEDGKGKSANYAAARQCAYRERATEDNDTFNGTAVLMMIYANGQGIDRNIPLAKRFSCEYGGWPFDEGNAAPAEIRARLQHLDEIASGSDKKPMDVCDDITSGMMGGLCASRDADHAQIEREARWSRLQADWTPAQRVALAELRKAAETYFDNLAGLENDMSGTARGMLAVDAHESLDRKLLDDVTVFENGQLPNMQTPDFAQADQALNATYRTAIAKLQADEKAGNSYGGAVTAEGVRDTQRSWLPYREAWAKFGTARYPSIAADAWRAWQTRERTKELGCAADIGTCDGVAGHDD